MTLTLDRPLSSTAAIAGAEAVTGAEGARASRRVVPALLTVAVVASGLLLAVQLSSTDFTGLWGRLRWWDLAAAIGFMALSMVAAAYNLIGFSPRPLRLGATVAAQLAVGGLRLIAPAALSMPAVVSRYLVRAGASTPEALATVAVAQTAQFVVTLLLVAGLGTLAGQGAMPASLDPGTAAVLVLTVAGAAMLAVVLARRTTVLGRRLASARMAATGQLTELLRHARRRPDRVLLGLAGSALLTGCHLLAFAFCVRAVGSSGTALSLTLIYLGAAGAGSLIPTPGGFGAVEAALIGGLSATGVPLPAATAAALLSRVVSVWLPALPGAACCYALRRRGLL